MISLQSPIHLMVNEDDGISAAGYLKAENERLQYENHRLRQNVDGAAHDPRSHVLYPASRPSQSRIDSPSGNGETFLTL